MSDDAALRPAERRAGLLLAGLMSLRMLGLFLVLPVLAAYANGLPGATPTLVGLAVGSYGLTQALLQVPSGRVTTYSEIAAAIGRPRAVRAVGTAVGRNPVSFLIPCHRAIRKGGGLGGYHWGLPVKRTILAWESAREEAG